MKIDETLGIGDKITQFLNMFESITKDESDYIAHILSWNDETKAAFLMAKNIFEE